MLSCTAVGAVQTTGLHFFNKKPDPSGQQYTGISVAQTAQRLIPKGAINNRTTLLDLALEAELALTATAARQLGGRTLSCGDPPAPLSTTLPNVCV